MRFKARGRMTGRRVGHADGPNKTEREYGQHLEQQKLAGEIYDYRFEGLKLRLANRTWLTVDYFVMRHSGLIELHEVKGHWEDDARVKMKVVAEMWPMFRFIAVRKTLKRERDTLGMWAIEEF